jgi:hypothetical protein
MVNESELRDVLVALIELDKKLYAAAAAALNEVAAVRETVRGLDPTFSENLAAHQAHYSETTQPSSSDVLQGFDELSERVKKLLLR